MGPYLEAVSRVSYGRVLSVLVAGTKTLYVRIPHHMPPVSSLCHIFSVAQRDHQFVEELCVVAVRMYMSLLNRVNHTSA